MQRSARTAGALFLAVWAAECRAQTTPEAPAKSLAVLYRELGGDRFSGCGDKTQFKAGADDARWLFNRFKEVGWAKVQEPYAASLDQLARAAEAPSMNAKAGCQMALAVARDLHVKRADCKAFGHSRTDIPVEIKVSANRGQSELAGWQVYTRWLPLGDRFTGAPKRLRDLSSPARGAVPVPGEYELYAEEPSSGARTGTERVSIGGMALFTWELPVSPGMRSPNRK